MPRTRLSKEEKELRKKAAQVKWQRKVGIRQGSPPPIVLAHRPVTRSVSAESQPAIQEASSTLSEPIRAPIAPVQSQSTALQKGREDSFVPLLNNDDDDFNNLGGDEDRPSEDEDLSEDEEIPRDKAPGSSYPYNQVSATGEQSASDTESDIETSATRKGKEKALPAIQESNTGESRPTQSHRGDDEHANQSPQDNENEIKQSTRRKGKGRALPTTDELVANALISSQGQQGHDQPSVRQDGAENPHLVSEEEDEQEDDLIRVFMRAPHTPPPIDDDYSGDEEPPIRRLDDNDDLDINLVNADNRDTEPEQEGDEEPAEEDLLAARLEAHRETGIDIIKEFTQQLISFHGCSQEEHEAQLQPPHIRSPTHCTLKEFGVLLRGAVPLVINKEKLMTLEERRAHIAPDWRLAFEGIRSDIKDPAATNPEPGPSASGANQDRNGVEGAPIPAAGASDAASDQDSDSGDSVIEYNPRQVHLCLACSQTMAPSLWAEYDIDSKLGFASSLAFAREGINLNLYPQYHQNIKTNIHLFWTIDITTPRGRKPKRVALHRIPHINIGRVHGAEDTEVYIFFPEMYNAQKVTNFPGKADDKANELIRVWMDEIFIPSLFEVLSPAQRMKYPKTWLEAKLRARAQYSERSTRLPVAGEEAYAKSLSDTVPKDKLRDFWQSVEQKLQRPEFQIYHSARIFCSSKNNKGDGAYPTLGGIFAELKHTLSRCFDMQYLDRKAFWVDIGKQANCPVYAMNLDDYDRDSPPITCLLRTCCQDSLARWALLGEKKSSVLVRKYNVSMLRDVVDMTLEMSPISLKRALGWVSSQSYNGVKNFFDAAKTKPFMSTFLPRLAWDAPVAEVLHQEGRGKKVDLSRVQAQFTEGKYRLHYNAQAASYSSWGPREESRVSLDFLDQVEDELRSSGQLDQPRSRIAADYHHVWQLRSSQYLRFVLLNTNKFLSACEWIWTLQPKQRIDYEHCKVLTMLLQAIPYAFDGGPIIRSNDLWERQVTRRKNGRVLLGMAWTRTSQAYGYAFFEGKCDWNSLYFRREFRDRMAFCSTMLHDAYRKNWEPVVGAKDDLERINKALD
jgi:hypothetical protein